MSHWISDLSLKYKFWAVNAVAFFTTLLLVLYAINLEHQARHDAAKSPPSSRPACSVSGRQSRPCPVATTC